MPCRDERPEPADGDEFGRAPIAQPRRRGGPCEPPTTEAKNRALADAARLARQRSAANIEVAGSRWHDAALQIACCPSRPVEAMARGLDHRGALPDPVGAEIERWTGPTDFDQPRARRSASSA